LARKVGDATPCRRWSRDRQLYEVLPPLAAEPWPALDDPWPPLAVFESSLSAIAHNLRDDRFDVERYAERCQ
jgi:hypothetical protein